MYSYYFIEKTGIRIRSNFRGLATITAMKAELQPGEFNALRLSPLYAILAVF